MRKRTVALIIVASILIVAVGGVYWFGRSLFHEPSAQGVDSVIGEVGGTRVVGIFAHPDDEQTVNGLFTRAKTHDDAYTYMVTATRGEAGTQVPVVARQKDLGTVRMAESLKNSFNMGVDGHEVWDYPDGGVPQSEEEELVERVADVLRQQKPDVVVAFWPESGATGHKDHMEMGRITELAILQVAEDDGAYTGPSHVVYTISPTKALTMFGGDAGAFVAENQPEPTHSMPAEVQKKHEGWAIHASQENYMQETYILPTWLIYALWDSEFYSVRDLAEDPLD
ncbi:MULTISPECIES: PIG-L deacetylase family protein [unclassified Salinibacterium]|uniref:PIG-L deacetylase family protein n=1 Tax=unclassified Salinibacterium TaxID=2632331 RepID=UPI00143CE9CE|nr:MULTISPECIES: PIG-L family deacetylase [unclassified Salinibacterium]